MADTSAPTLHSYWRSSAAYRVRICLLYPSRCV